MFSLKLFHVPGGQSKPVVDDLEADKKLHAALQKRLALARAEVDRQDAVAAAMPDQPGAQPPPSLPG